MFFIFAILLTAQLRLTFSQVPYFGQCPEVETLGDFDAENYTGKWYEAERYFSLYEFGGRCINSVYSEGADNQTLKITNLQTSTISGVISKANGFVSKSPTGVPAQMKIAFPYLPVNSVPYWVLDTDYDSFSVVWSCYNIGGYFSTRNAWILTRERNPPLEVMEKAYRVLDRNSISRAFFIRTDQTNCTDDS